MEIHGKRIDQTTNLEFARMKMRKKSRGVVSLIGSNMPEVKVCDIINGKPKVKRIDKEDCIEFVLRYSLFHKVVKRYDKNTFQELQ